MRLRVVCFGRTACQQQRASQFAFLKAEDRPQEQAIRVIRIDSERLLQRRLGFFDAAELIEQLRLLAEDLRIARVGLLDLVDDAQGRVVLAVGLLLVGPPQVAVDRLAAPAVLLAAATRARGVVVDGHGRTLFSRRDQTYRCGHDSKTANSREGCRRATT